MARRQSKAARTTIYRLIRITDLGNAIRQRYVDNPDFEMQSVEVQGREGLLATGRMITESAAWSGRLSALTGVPIDLGNETAAGALILRETADTAWALTYGMGFQLIDQNFIDPGFGQRIAVRTADPDALRSVTRTTLDYRARTDRSSIPSGEQVRGFGLGDFGELVSRVVGSASLPGLTGGSGKITIRGADALNVPLGKDASALLDDLDLIREVLDRPPLPGLEALEQLTPVKDREAIDTLEGTLRSALEAEDPSRLAIGWPHERIDENGTPTSFRIYGAGRDFTGPHDDVPTLDLLRQAILLRNPHDALAGMNGLKLQLYRDPDGDEPISGSISAVNWLAYEVDLDGSRYCLHDGRWYLLDQDYVGRLQAHVQEIFARQIDIELPEWTSDYPDEDAYNKAAAKALNGVCLDKRLITTSLHHRGIEPCDVLEPLGRMIHVKHLRRSTAASHLIAQALVSTDALRFDEEARTKLRQRVEEVGGDASWLPARPESVVLGLASRRELQANDLFTFSQVTLARFDKALGESGVSVYVIPVLRT